MAILQNCYSVGFAASDFLHLHLLQGQHEFGFWLVRASVFVFGHGGGVGMTELSAATASPGVKLAVVSQGNRMGVAASDLDDFDSFEKLHNSWRRLVRIAFYVRWQIFHRRQAELPARTALRKAYLAPQEYTLPLISTATVCPSPPATWTIPFDFRLSISSGYGFES